jgi:CHAD domain-containing protein
MFSGANRQPNLSTYPASISVKRNGSHAHARAAHPLARPCQVLGPDAAKSLGECLITRWKRCCKQLARCRRGLSEPAVHDVRVEARRLLSRAELGQALLPAGLIMQVRREVKELLDCLGKLRDVQVQLRAVSRLARRFPIAEPFSNYLRKRERRFRRTSCDCIARFHPRCLEGLVESCCKEFRRQRKKRGPEAANQLLLRSARRAYLRACAQRARMVATRPESIHRARIALREFRYMAESILELEGRTDKALVSKMRRYQGRMGAVQDVHVLLMRLEKYLRKHGDQEGVGSDLRSELVLRRVDLSRKCVEGSDELFPFRLPGVIEPAPVPAVTWAPHKRESL